MKVGEMKSSAHSVSMVFSPVTSRSMVLTVTVVRGSVLAGLVQGLHECRERKMVEANK